jgi:hypothetical protein
MFTFRNGKEYEGDWVNGLFQGFGKLAFGDEDQFGRIKYEGEWKAGEPWGNGRMIYKNGQKYDGMWENGIYKGYGLFLFPINDTEERASYEGEFENGIQWGNGTVTWKDGKKYKGQFENGALEGFGQFDYSPNDYLDRKVYVGEWKANQHWGTGTLVFKDGAKYEGQWKNGEYDGFGTFIFPDNSSEILVKYEGGFKSGIFWGNGTMYFKDGSKYEGGIENKVAEGFGIATYNKDDIFHRERYVGMWRAGTHWGNGTVYYKEGTIYEGGFENGKFQGYGVFVYTLNDSLSRERYEGDWNNDFQWGNGTMYYRSGLKYSGGIVYGDFNGYGILTYPESDTSGIKYYEGDWKGNLPGGNGTMVFKNGTMYEGEWQNGLGNGFGVFTIPDNNTLPKEFIIKYVGFVRHFIKWGKGKAIAKDGRYYEGSFENNLYSGFGILTFAESDNLERVKYEGNWKFGEPWGNGSMYFKGMRKYEGSWVNGVLNGHGICTYGDNDTFSRVKYEGEWFYGLQKGNGSMIYTDGRKYIGEWDNGMLNGYGVFTYAENDLYNRSRYIGQWKHDTQWGRGKMLYKYGKQYEGDLVNGFADGRGVLTFPDNDDQNRAVYEGEVKCRKMWGKGVLKFKNGEKYEGDFVNDMYEGFGVLTFAEDDPRGRMKYEGELKANYFWGNGTLAWKDGSQYEGQWEIDERKGFGIYTFPTNNSQERNYYEGNFRDSKFWGNGTLFLNNGTSIEAQFEDGEIEKNYNSN